MFDCCKSDGRADTGVKGTLERPGSVEAPQFRVSNYKSPKLDPAYYRTLPDADKDAILAEAFKILLATVEPSKIPTNVNPAIKQMMTKLIVKDLKTSQGVYEGETIHGVANGKGKLVSHDGHTTYDGDFFNGLRHGVGKVEIRHKDGSKSNYEGRFQKGELVSAVEVKTTGGNQEESKIYSYLKGELLEGPFILEYPASKEKAYGGCINDKFSGDVIFIQKGQPGQPIFLESYKKEGSDDPVTVKEFEEAQPAPQPQGGAPVAAGGQPKPQSGQPAPPNNAPVKK